MDRSFYLIGGAPWLNLINTRYLHNKSIYDLLDDPESLAAWIEANQLIPIEILNSLAHTEQVLLRDLLKEHREMCRAVLGCLQEGNLQMSNAAAVMQRCVSQLKIEPKVTLVDHNLAMIFEGKTWVDSISYRITHSIIETFRVYSTDRIRKCEHEECILHFVDISKGGKRRWCSMEVCGNRNKAAEHYAKQKRRNQMQGHD